MKATTIDEVLSQLSGIIAESRQAGDMSNARDGAWCFAEDLFALSGDAYTTCVDARDKDIAKLGSTLVHFRAMLRLTVWVIHLFECKDPKRIIGVLQDYKKTFIHVMTDKKIAREDRIPRVGKV